MSAVPPMPRAGLPSQTATRAQDLDAYLAQFAARYRCRMSSLVQWASSHAEGLLGPLGARWAHVQAVAGHLEALGVDRRLCCLVAHHSGATFEAEERGYAGELAAFKREDGPLMDA